MKSNPRFIYNRLRSRGLTHAQACGVLGNIQQESGFETDVLGFDHTGSYGLCQWLGPRKRALEAFSKRTESSMANPLTQIDFIFHEFDTTEKRAGLKLRECDTPGGAALCFSKYYERPHKDYAHNDQRCTYARQWDAFFQPEHHK